MDDVKDWPRPHDEAWPLFEQAVEHVFATWDVLDRATDEEWAGEQTDFFADKLVDDILANYAERWCACHRIWMRARALGANAAAHARAKGGQTRHARGCRR